jgi:hypothetical protein
MESKKINLPKKDYEIMKIAFNSKNLDSNELKQISADVHDCDLVESINSRKIIEENLLNSGSDPQEQSDLHSQNIQVNVNNLDECKTEIGSSYLTIKSSNTSGSRINNQLSKEINAIQQYYLKIFFINLDLNLRGSVKSIDYDEVILNDMNADQTDTDMFILAVSCLVRNKCHEIHSIQLHNFTCTDWSPFYKAFENGIFPFLFQIKINQCEGFLIENLLEAIKKPDMTLDETTKDNIRFPLLKIVELNEVDYIKNLKLKLLI